MSIFKNANESGYVGGRKHYTDIIKNSSPSDVLFWQNPEEDFNNNSTLIVAESEEALFFNDGVIEQVFTGGKYTLSTENYPFIGRLRNMLSGGVSAFNCKVYFVRTADSKEILWGTQTPIQVIDPVWDVPTKIFARGAYKVRIADSKRFLLKMVGNNVPYLTVEEFTDYFQSQFSQHIKTLLAKGVQSFNSEILGIMARQEEFAQLIMPRFEEILADYGITLVNFTIESLDIPEDDPRREELYDKRARVKATMLDSDARRIEAMADADIRVMGAQGEAAAMDIMGERWARQQSAEILRDLANNDAAGGVAAMGAGMGMGVASAGVFSNLSQAMFAPFTDATQASGVGAQTTTRSRFVQQGATAPQQTAPAAQAQSAPASDDAAAFASAVQAQQQPQPTVPANDATAFAAAVQAEQPAPAVSSSAASTEGGQASPPQTPSAQLAPEQPERIFCTQCGAQNPAQAKFCSSCGNRLQARVCAQCGAELMPDSKFCNQCGAKVEG